MAMRRLARSKRLVLATLKYLRRRRRNREFVEEFREFSAASARAGARFPLRWDERRPFLNDNTPTTRFDRHYVYHPAWAARMVAELRPSVHVDIASSLHFATIVSAFVPVRFYDYRPADLQLGGLESLRADLMGLPFETDSVASLSCMHVVEHIGLGRYGDPLDPDGDLKAIGELKRVLAPGGTLLFVVPVGVPRIEFNAQRVYSYTQVRDYFSGLDLTEFSMLPDDPARGLIRDADPALADAQRYACGCFAFRKPLPATP